MQSQSLTCESPIEKGCYNCKGRVLKLKEIFFQCGEKGTAEFLFGLQQLREKNVTNRCNCFLICVACLEKGKKVMKGRKKSVIQARKKREAKASSSGN